VNLKGETPTSGRFTIIDVARLSGVAPATVSKALDITGRYGLSEEVRRRVVEAADQLNYRSRSHGRRPMRSKFRLVGLIHGVIDATSEHTGPIFQVMADALALRDHHLLHVNCPSDPNRFKESLPDEHRISGWLGVGELNEFIEQALRQLGQPVVLLGGSADCVLSQVLPDEGQAANLLVRHLFDLGHVRIALCMGSPRVEPATRLARLEGYRGAMRRLGLNENSEVLASPSDWLMRRSPAAADRPTAIIADSPSTAIEILDSCWSRGIRIPGDLCLASFDDNYAAEQMKITAIQPRLEQAAKEAVNLLLDQIEGRQSTLARKILVGATLSVRQSTGPSGGEILARSA